MNGSKLCTFLVHFLFLVCEGDESVVLIVVHRGWIHPGRQVYSRVVKTASSSTANQQVFDLLGHVHSIFLSFLPGFDGNLLKTVVQRRNDSHLKCLFAVELSVDGNA